jgi:hypothetical protein
MNIELKITDKKSIAFPIVIKDDKGNEIYVQFSDGNFSHRTYDKKGNQLTLISSYGSHYIKNKSVTQKDFEAFCFENNINIDFKGFDNKDKLIELLKDTIEDYRRLVVKYKESEQIRDRLIENQKKQIANQLEMINLLADGLK